MIRATVAVCTRNRVDLLAGCLATVDTQLFEVDAVEVLVVDNGSTDGTPDLLRTWSSGGPLRRSVREPRVGLVHARNAALATSEREVVIFLDDDALVPPTWAAAHLAGYLPGAGVGAIGGPVGLVWPAARPAWIVDALTPWYSALDLGDDAVPYPNEHGPYGTNMSVWRSAALGVGGFDARFGRRGRRLLSGEERDLSRRLVQAGWRLRYEPTAAVVQQVLPERVSRRWLLRRAWAQGISDARFDLVQVAGTRRSRLTRARAELTATTEQLDHQRPDRTMFTERLPNLTVALAHAGAAGEFARTAVAGAPRPDRRDRR
ncbi:MAG TPA: glycosyltransferase [Nakamurella sp.]